MSKYIQVLNYLSHDEKLIINSEMQTKAMAIKYNLCEVEALVFTTTYQA